MMRTPHRLLAISGNAIVVGATGLSAPIAWLLVPVVVAVSARPRVAAVVAACTGLLIFLSVLIPLIPGHRDEVDWLVGSAANLALRPMMAWVRERRQLDLAAPGVNVITPRSARRPAALALSRAPAEVATSVRLRGGSTRVVLGVLQGDVTSPSKLGWSIQHGFRALASRRRSSLAEIAHELDGLVTSLGKDMHMAATLVEICSDGKVLLLRCGGPKVLALPRSPSRTCEVIDKGSGALPLGLGAPSEGKLTDVPMDLRLAVVTAAYSTEHYDDYANQVQQALRASSPELAAVQLLLGRSGGADALGPALVGPALVIEPRNLSPQSLAAQYSVDR